MLEEIAQSAAKAIWDEFSDDDVAPPPGRPLTVAAYIGGPCPEVFLEPAAVGAPLPEVPLFLTRDEYVPAPLEATYQTTWHAFPAALKGLLETVPQPPRES